MIDLTKGEEQILYLLWELGEGSIQDIIASIDQVINAAATTVLQTNAVSSIFLSLPRKNIPVNNCPAWLNGILTTPLLHWRLSLPKITT